MQAYLLPLAAIGNLDAGAVSYQIMGMLVVFCCLSLLSIILSISGGVAIRMENRRRAKQDALAARVPVPSPSPSSPGELSPATVAALAAGIYDTASSSITPEIVAVIAAAVKCTVGSEARVLSIQPVDAGYARSGRSAIMASHLPKRG